MVEEAIIVTTVTNPKPFVQAACICEKVLIEPDNVASLIRIVDTLTLPDRLPPDTLIAPILILFVSLKSGDVVGEHEVGLQLNSPDGKASPRRKWPVVFSGGEHGANLKFEFGLQPPQVGLYWFDVLWDEDVLTRVPFRLKSTGEPSAQLAAPNETSMTQS
jgi:hypothetical protein